MATAIADTLADMIIDSDAPEEHKNAVRLIRENQLLNNTISNAVEKITLSEAIDPVKVKSAYEYVKLLRVNAETFFAALEKSESPKPQNEK